MDMKQFEKMTSIITSLLRDRKWLPKEKLVVIILIPVLVVEYSSNENTLILLF